MTLETPPYVRLAEAHFPARLTAKSDDSGGWRYAWLEQDFDPATGAYSDADPGRSGTAGVNYATELRGLEVAVGTGKLFWMRLKGSVGQEQSYEFVSQGGGDGDTYNFTDTTINYLTDVLNFFDTTINYTDVDVFITNVNFTINTNYTWYVGGDGFVIFDAPFTICDELFWCYTTYNVATAELDDWTVPGTARKVVVRLTSSADFVLTGMVPASTVAALAGVPSQADGDGWVAPDNVFASDDARATYALARNATSDGLSAQGFGLDVPGNATILGITVGVERSKAGTGVLSDTEFALLKASVPAGTHKHSVADWPGADAVLTLGGAADLWGTTWTPAEVNDAEFGVELLATENNTAAVTLRVDAVTVTVTYRITDGGQVVWLHNCSDTSVMTLAHDSTSTAAYRFKLEGNADNEVEPNGDALCWYDPESLRWRTHRQPAASGGSTPAFSGALVKEIADQIITGDTLTEIVWTGSDYDTDAYWDAGAPNNFVVPADGWYRVGARVQWFSSQYGVYRLVQIIQHTGGDPVVIAQNTAANPSFPQDYVTPTFLVHSPTQETETSPLFFSAGTALSARVRHDALGGMGVLSLLDDAEFSARFWIYKVG